MNFKKSSSLFYKCLFISLGVHLIALLVFYVQPPFLRPYFNTFFSKAPTTIIPLEEEDIALSEKNIALEEILNHILVLQREKNSLDPFENSVCFRPYPSIEKESNVSLSETIQPVLNSVETPISLPTIDLADASFDFKENTIEDPLMTTQLPYLNYDKTLNPEYLSPLSATSVDQETKQFSKTSLPLEIQYVPSIEQEKGEVAILERRENTFLLHPHPLEKEISALSLENLYPLPEWKEKLVSSSSFSLENSYPLSLASTLPDISSYSLIQDVAEASWSDHFEVELNTLPREQGGYFFSVTLIPKYDLSQKTLKQNIFFLIDRSSSIEKYRYQTFKRAVIRALSGLQEGMGFNIILFNKKIVKMSEHPVAFSKKTLQMAEDFLEKQEKKNSFSATDVYKNLEKIIPSSVSEQESNTAILISDGDTSLSREKQRLFINAWMKNNNGKVALYTAAVGQDNNLALLEVLSSLNRGSLLYVDTHASFPRKLTKMLLDLRHPIAKNVVASFLNTDSQTKIELYSSSLPALFNKQPYTIYGTTNSLADFTLVLQGENKKQLVTITKEISFGEIKNSSPSLEKECLKQQAASLYEEYLQNGNLSSLEQAHQFLNDAFTHYRR